MKASLAKKLSGFQEPDHSFLALRRGDANFNRAALYVKDSVGDVALMKDVLVLGKPEDGFPWSCLYEEGDEIKWSIFGL